ncbi:MAG TPA: hypothetical protein VKG79_12685 [Bryobacteraceae bacterium]|nr:hypothetical protein [Bryobacteraceae bacterium]
MHRRILSIAFVLATALSAADLAGTYKGSYSGSAGASGAFTIALSQSAGAWKAGVSFDLGGDVKAKTTSVEVDGAKVRVVYQFEFQGATLESTAIAELKGSKFEGTYQTKTVGDGSQVDQGQWNATRQQ